MVPQPVGNQFIKVTPINDGKPLDERKLDCTSEDAKTSTNGSRYEPAWSMAYMICSLKVLLHCIMPVDAVCLKYRVKMRCPYRDIADDVDRDSTCRALDSVVCPMRTNH